MPIKNYTTEVSEERTVGEIMGILAGKGARSIKIDYDDQNRPTAVSFIIVIKTFTGDEFGVPVPFRLPCNFDGVFNAIKREYKDSFARGRFERNPESRLQARRIAWRIIKNWIEAQMALVESDCAALAQVFLPYASQESSDGREVTIYQRFLEQVGAQKQLASGGQ